MKKTLRVCLLIVLSILLIVSLGGCSSGINDKPPVEDNPPAGDSGHGDPVGGDDGNNEPKDFNGVTAKVLSQGYPAEIEKYLENNKTKETQQALNINNRTYIVLTMGEQTSGGYTIELKDLVLEDGILKVFVKYVKPGKDDMVATVMTYPSLVIETDKIYEGHYEIAYDIEQ
ncbi:MAG: hypothetical protein APF84_00585 [Gracilibacter sp. BRH_c7a]|nr:MAG: hypothetical protein APF84_00585 [Gracilibacter sp. BRH_c7a]